MSQPRVLIIDDEESICSALKLAFEKAGCPVQTALTAEDGLEHIQRVPFDILLVDKNLPGMSGLDFIAKLREADPDTAVVLMTGFSSFESAKDALNLDVDAYIEKPFRSIFGVVDLAREVLEKRRARLVKALPVSGRAVHTLLRILVLAVGSGQRAKLSAEIEKQRGEVHFAGETPDLPESMKTLPPDVIVIDGTSFPNTVLDVAERCMLSAPLATYVVVYDKDLGLPALQKLIELGVKGLFDSKAYGRSINELLEKAWVRKSVLAGLARRS